MEIPSFLKVEYVGKQTRPQNLCPPSELHPRDVSGFVETDWNQRDSSYSSRSSMNIIQREKHVSEW